MADSRWITEDLLLPYFNQINKKIKTKGGIISLDEMERRLIKRALEEYGTSVKGKERAAKALNISLATLYNKIKKYDIK